MQKYALFLMVVLLLASGGLFFLSAQPATPAQNSDNSTTPRTLEGYVEQEKPFFDYLLKHHPIFQYEKDGRMVGKYHISDRDEEFVEEGGGKDYSKQNNRQVSMTYRLGMESILDLPNRFVGAKKCGECHPAQYEKWVRSRHAKVVRFPDEMEEVPNQDLKAGLYGGKASVLPEGITADAIYAVIGTPRTKYGFVDGWLVRGTYHVEGGFLKDGTGTLVAGGNQFSRTWAESFTPEVVQTIAGFVPGFPTKLEDFGDNGSKVWGMTSYGAKNRKTMLFQPATAYCEICHTFKFDFKSDAELIAALGHPDELRKHTVSKGIGCEECHGAGAHLYGARGAGLPSNCERCHQRFAWNEEQAKKDPAHPFTAFFKTKCPACGTEGSQGYNTAHYSKGIRCTTCHDPHEVTENDWKDSFTVPALKKQCADCHADQQAFFANNEIHGKNKCESCHMPNMMSCENFGTIQYPDSGGFDTARAAHIWRIVVSPDEKTLNPPEGKDRNYKDGSWRLTKKDGKPYVDLMWSCGRTSYMDGNVIAGGGCHSGVQSFQAKELKFTNQKMIYDRVVAWQKPVKDGIASVQAALAKIDSDLNKARLNAAEKAQVQLMANQAQEIVTAVQRDGSWGVHGPSFTLKKVNQAKLLTDGAIAALSGNSKLVALAK
ncbi:MAG TPA: cytochrome C [Bryobacteraceae bacterium]|nr:cytochrome C [Bryobacteraceae bacterium]